MYNYICLDVYDDSRLVIVMSADLCFDAAMEDAQAAGISGVWMGKQGNGAFYPANTTHRLPFSTVPWKRWSVGSSEMHPRFVTGLSKTIYNNITILCI